MPATSLALSVEPIYAAAPDRAAVRLFMAQAGVAIASATAAAFLRLDGELGAIAPGRRADLILVDDGLTVVRRSWIGGRE